MITMSKSKYLAGLQCPKRLWLETHRRDLIPPVSASQQRVFDTGHLIGDLARKRFPCGHLFNEDPFAWREVLSETQEHLAKGTPVLYEPCFLHDNAMARPDILARTSDGSYDLFELKSTTRVKDEHLHDLAVQTYIYEGSGISIKGIHLMHLNTACRYPDLSNLFTADDVTESVRSKYLPQVPAKLASFLDTLNQDQEPERRLGSYCSSPYECPFFGYCSRQHSLESPSVFDIPFALSQAKDKLLADGYLSIRDLPDNLEDYAVGTRGIAFIQLCKEQKVDINIEGIRRWLTQLQYPLYFLDFETDAPALPRLPGLGPYGTVPFQFSLHILNADGSLDEAPGFLHLDTSDPRPAIAQALLDQIGPAGSIVAYNASFERRVIRELADYLPSSADDLNALNERFVDLLDIFRQHYQDYRFNGSNSIKAVLPVICPELSYKTLVVANGEAAQASWSKMISSNDEVQRLALAEALRSYCRLDTLAMVRILEYIQGLSKSNS
ncbi:DUF2779 domain-containing protein [Spirochaetota bacterium]